MDINANTDTLMDMGIQEDYTLKRLVYVNSANHGYSEIPLDHHLAMFGRNNVGKTASLAGTKLLLFPETSFHNCEKKFGFKGKDGSYTKEESYDFYFPDARSFLILEEMNPEGTFCMVLYRRNNYAYGRYFIPLRFAEIRHLFWDNEANTFAADLSIKTIDRFVKINDGIQVNDKSEIASLMYASFKSEKTRKRFCVLPLKDDDGDCVKAFKSIYQLAFETSHNDTSTLPKAIASLLEMNRGRPQERLDANLKALTDAHTTLVQKQHWLTELKNHEPTFQRVKRDFERIEKQNTDYAQFYHALASKLNDEKRSHASNWSRVDREYLEVDNEKQRLNGDLERLTNKVKKSEWQHDNNKKKLNKSKNEINKAKALISKYIGKTAREVCDTLEDEVEKLKQALESYRSEKGVKDKLEQNIAHQNRLREKICKLSDLISKSNASLLHNLGDKGGAGILLSLNSKFADISSELSADQRTDILKFTQLFETDGLEYLCFLGSSMEVRSKPYDHNAQTQQWKKDLEELEGENQKLSKEIDEQNLAIRNKDIPQLIAKTERSFNETQADLDLIKALGKSKKDAKELSTEIEREKLELDSLRLELEALRNTVLSVDGRWQTLRHEHKELSEAQNMFKRVEHDLDRAKNSFKPQTIGESLIHDLEFNDATLRTLIDNAYACREGFSKFRNTLHELISAIAHEGIDPHQRDRSLEECADIVRQYESTYSTLAYEEQQYRNEIRQHNQVVNNQLAEMTNAKNDLLTFTKGINKALNTSPVSNLSEIELHLSLNPRFLSLLETLDKHDIQDDALLDGQFYSSLAQFVDSYFNKKTRRLKLHDIIESITYRYRLADTGELVTKSQSGGTSSTITALVLSVLLKRLSPNYVSLSIPIIVDEISTLDANNTEATIQQIAAHGFSIFCATPSFSASIVQKVNRFVSIDQCQVIEPMVSKCHLNILPVHIEEFGKLASEA